MFLRHLLINKILSHLLKLKKKKKKKTEEEEVGHHGIQSHIADYLLLSDIYCRLFVIGIKYHVDITSYVDNNLEKLSILINAK